MQYGMFKYKSPNFKKLMDFGFSYDNARYSYCAPILDGQFELSVKVYENGEIETAVTDLALREPYTLYLVEEASGSFVGRVRAEIEEILDSIADSCFERNVFKEACAHGVIEYARNTYGDELEFLWEKIPAGAVLRRKDNRKWYAIIMVISKRKLGLDSDEEVSIIDLRLDQSSDLVDGKRFFKGYHMNKRTWFTICLDGSVALDEICGLLDKSYELAKKK